MPQESKIEWCDATWNPVTGCSKVSQGCKNCYAEAYFARPYPGRKFTDVKIHPDRLDWPLRWRGSPKAKAEGRPSRIFVNSMSDLFHEDVPDAFLDAAFSVMGRCAHNFQILTKRPQRMLRFLGRKGLSFGAPLGARLTWPFPNCHLLVSVENQPTADERVPLLLQTPAAVHGVSYEPALGPAEFSGYITDERNPFGCRLDWIVAGGESGPHARPPRPDWFRSVRDQCQAAGVPFFFKQWGAFLPAGQDGARIDGHQEVNASDAPIYLGKKKAGRLLDGREHNEFPAAREL